VIALTRGGRSFRIAVFDNKEDARIVLFSANKRYSGAEVPRIDTGFHRPSRSIKIFLEEWIRRGYTDDAPLFEVPLRLYGRRWKSIFDNLFSVPKGKN